MNELALVIERYATWLYLLIGLSIARQIYTLWRAAAEQRSALFGLERDAAFGKAVRALIALLLFVTVGLGVYAVQTVVAPGIEAPPDEAPRRPPIIETPPTASLETDTPEPAASPTRPPARVVTRPPAPAP